MSDTAVVELPEGVQVEVPEGAPDWAPQGYVPGPDDPGDVETECGPGADVAAELGGS